MVAGGRGRRERRGEGTVWESGMDMYTLLYLKWITKKDLLYSTGNSAQCYVAAWMGGKFWGEWIPCICVTESLHCSPETITTLFVSQLNPIQNKKLKKKGKICGTYINGTLLNYGKE